MNTLENFKAELESAMEGLSKAAGPVMEKIRDAVAEFDANMGRTSESMAFVKRINTLPPNIRQLVLCGMLHIESAERIAEHHGDISDWELFEIKDAFVPSPVLAEELKALRMPEPQPIKQIPNGIPWNKKQKFNRPMR